MAFFKKTVQPETWGLLKALMNLSALSNFALVGGTNLSLRFGHRKSEDLDLFTNTPFQREQVWSAIREKYPKTIKIDEHKQTLLLNINEIKVDLILHQYPYLKPIDNINNIRMLAIEDIIPMKLEAMATRGVKKDFWDIATLLDYFSFAEMLDLHQQKYKQSDMAHIIMSATYFEDAEKENINPIDLKGLTWEKVKETMRIAVLKFMDNLNFKLPK